MTLAFEIAQIAATLLASDKTPPKSFGNPSADVDWAITTAVDLLKRSERILTKAKEANEKGC